MAYLAREATERCDLFNGRRKIFDCAGNDDHAVFSSVESYSCPDNCWTLEPAMNEKRSVHSAFVHGREVHVGGGWTGTKYTDSSESLNVDEKNLKWKPQFKLPIQCTGHKIVCHENSAILTGDTISDGDGIYEVSLNLLHNTKLLTQMPELRCSHGCEIIDNHESCSAWREERYHATIKVLEILCMCTILTTINLKLNHHFHFLLVIWLLLVIKVI